MCSEKQDPGVTGKAVDADSISSTRGNPQSGPPAPRSLRERISRPFRGIRYYGWEILGVVVSGASIVAIALLVNHFDGKPRPPWETKVYGTGRTFTLTLNSLLSIISTLGSTCAMIPVTKGLGQLKYLWFLDKDRTLSDLDTFDSASRGKLGSAQLLWKLRFKHLAVFGAMASLLALAYGPFIQNLVVVQIDYVEGGLDAQLAFSVDYQYNDINNSVIDSVMKFSINAALRDDRAAQWMIPPNVCQTGNCVWHEYYTIGACSRCKNITDKLTLTCTARVGDGGGCDVKLSNGFGLRTGAADTNIVMAMNTTGKPYFDHYAKPFTIVQSILAFDPQQYPKDGPRNSIRPYVVTEDSILSAHECAIVPCVQKQSFSLTKPVTERDRKTKLSPDAEPAFPWLYVSGEWMEVDEGMSGGDAGTYINVDSAGAEEGIYRGEHFFINPWSFEAVRSYLNTTLRGYVKWLPDPQGQTSELRGESDWENTGAYGPAETTMELIFNNSVQGTWTGWACNNSDWTSGDVACGMANLAQGITNGMRAAKWQEIKRVPPPIVEGLTYIPTEICHVQWQWLSVPIAVWILGLVLLVGTILKTRKARIRAWRTSPLAMLLLSLDADGISHLRDWQKMGDEQLKEVSASLKIRLRADDGGIRFVKPRSEPGQAV